MEILILLISIGTGVYLFRRLKRRRGTEAVRAAVFLQALQAGQTVKEANGAAELDFSSISPDVVRDAVTVIQRDYGGKQLAMTIEAYRQGMRAK